MLSHALHETTLEQEKSRQIREYLSFQNMSLNLNQTN
jgi:hypothetical protein